MSFATADLCDDLGPRARVVDPVFRDLGGAGSFSGTVSTVRVLEDNVLVRAALEEAGEGRVLVVDGAGSLRCALLGGDLARMAAQNGWSGVLVNGAVRDRAEVLAVPMGVRALATCPRRSVKRGEGERDVPVRFAGVLFRPGERLYADADGIVVVEGEG